MDARIFNGNFFLKFLEKELNDDYEKLKIESLLKYYTIISILMLFLSTCGSIENFFFISKVQSNSFNFVLYCSLLTSIYYLISVFVVFFIKNIKVLKIFHYINYLGIILTCGFIRYPMIHFLKLPPVILIVFLLIEILARILWAILNVMDFKENLILHLVEILIIWVFLFPTSDPTDKNNLILYNFICYTFFFFMISLFFYIIEKQRKKSFYFQTILKDQVNSLNNIFENTRIGFMSIKENKIKLMNSFLKKSIQKFKNSLEVSEIIGKIIIRI